MPWRTRAFVLVALLAAGVFARLGFWQVGRLNSVREANAQLFERRRAAPVALESLPAVPDSARFRAVAVRGRYDYDHQFRLTARSRAGAPGVVFVTPVVRDDSGAAVLVYRGWVYAADGMTVDDTLWREGERAEVEGYVETYPAGIGPVQVPSAPGRGGLRRLDRDSLQADLPYVIAPVLVVQQVGAGAQMGQVRHPFRLERPTLDEGPHRGYALQWFAFAAITVLGTIAVVVREREVARRGA